MFVIIKATFYNFMHENILLILNCKMYVTQTAVPLINPYYFYVSVKLQDHEKIQYPSLTSD